MAAKSIQSSRSNTYHAEPALKPCAVQRVFDLAAWNYLSSVRILIPCTVKCEFGDVKITVRPRGLGSTPKLSLVEDCRNGVVLYERAPLSAFAKTLIGPLYNKPTPSWNGRISWSPRKAGAKRRERGCCCSLRPGFFFVNNN